MNLFYYYIIIGEVNKSLLTILTCYFFVVCVYDYIREVENAISYFWEHKARARLFQTIGVSNSLKKDRYRLLNYELMNTIFGYLITFIYIKFIFVVLYLCKYGALQSFANKLSTSDNDKSHKLFTLYSST